MKNLYRFLRAFVRRCSLVCNDAELINLWHTSIKAQRDSVGIGHIIEPFSIVGSDVIRDRVVRESRVHTDVNRIIMQLFEPDEQSFLFREEQALRKIAWMPEPEQQKQLSAHLEKYYWLENTYASSNTVTLQTLLDRMHRLQEEKQSVQSQEKKINKERLMEEMGLSAETRILVRALNVCTIWQDERKLKILQSISSIDAVLGELARRSGVEHSLLRYVGVYEGLDTHSVEALRGKEGDLALRRAGCFYYIRKDREYFATGEEYKELSVRHRADPETDAPREIRGMIANLGTATGEARVCFSAEDIENFPEGSVLVAPMTRPEYISAMKKAVAIVTDEGGITSHASIVSRELGVPCVIGTKVATKVLRNGDLVEVRANHGYVRVIHK